MTVRITLSHSLCERHSHVTFAASEEAECKPLGHLSKVAHALGVVSAGAGQGAQEVIGQIAATFL